MVVKQKGNCEDLFFNFIFRKLYQKLPGTVVTENSDFYLDTTNGFKEDFDSLKLRNNFCKKVNNK